MAEALPWIMIGVVAALVVLVAIVFVFKRKKGKIEEDADYRAFFLMGISWIMIGLPMTIFYGFEFNALFAMGIIFTIMGAANRPKWKKEPLTKNQRISWIAVFVAMLVLASVVGYIKLVVQA